MHCHSYLFNIVDFFFQLIVHPSEKSCASLRIELKLSCQIYCYVGPNQARPLHRQHTEFYSWYLENKIKDSQVGHSVWSFLGSSIAGPTSFQRPCWISTAFLLILSVPLLAVPLAWGSFSAIFCLKSSFHSWSLARISLPLWCRAVAHSLPLLVRFIVVNGNINL